MSDPTANTSENYGSATPYKYDAFISYKHGPVDSEAAITLQRNLEHFHVPLLSASLLSSLPFTGRNNEKKEKKIRRVFLDKEEMTAGNSLSSALQNALQQSEWLIVICSGSTKESPWVDLEIRDFLKTHDRGHILTVMIEGEPGDVIPDILNSESMLPEDVRAADARGRNIREIRKKLKGSALLEIAAPMLGTTLYDLTQRHRVYRMKRITTAAVICLAAVTGFLMYAFSQNRKLERTNSQLLLRQAEVITKEASELLSEGDNLHAVENLLSVLPDPSSGEAATGSLDSLLPATQYELTNALNLYKPELEANFGEEHVSACAVIRNQDYLNPDLLSDETGSFLFAASDNTIYVWDAKTSRPVNEIPFTDYLKNWSEEALLSGNRIILCGSHTAACYNYVTGEQLWRTTVLNEICAVCGPFNTEEQAQRDTCLYILTKAGISILQSNDGSILSEKKYRLVSAEEPPAGPDEEYEIDTESGAAAPEENEEYDLETDEGQDDEKVSQIGSPDRAVFSSGGDFLIFSSYSESGGWYLFAAVPETGETILIDPQKYSQFEDLAAAPSEFETDSFYYAAYYTNSEGKTICCLKAVSLKDSDSTLRDTGKINTEKTSQEFFADKEKNTSSIMFHEEWKKEYPLDSVRAFEDNTPFSMNTAEGPVLIRPGRAKKAESPLLYLGCFSRLCFLDPSDGRTIHEVSLPANLTGLFPGEGFCTVRTSRGNLYSFDGNNLQRLTDVLPSGCNDIEQIGDSSVFYCLQDNSRITRYAPISPDTRYAEIKGFSASGLSAPAFQNQDMLVWIDYDEIFWASEQDNTFHSSSFSELTGKVPLLCPEITGLDEDPYSFQVTPAALEDDLLHFIYAVDQERQDGTEGTVYFHLVLNLSDSNISAEPLFILNDSYSYPKLSFAEESFTIYLLVSNGNYVTIWSFNLRDKSKERKIIPLRNIQDSYLSPDGKKMLLISEDDLKMYILRLDSYKTEAAISLSGYVRNTVDRLESSSTGSVLCWNGDTLAVADYMKIHVYDRTGKEIHTIPCGKSTNEYEDFNYPALALSPDGKSLYYYLSGTLFQYSLSRGQMINEAVLIQDLRTVPQDGEGVSFWFRADGSETGTNAEVPDTLYILHNNSLFIVRCEERSFGLTARIENVPGYNTQSRKIYVTRLNENTWQYELKCYKEYTLRDIVGIAKEMYPPVN